MAEKIKNINVEGSEIQPGSSTPAKKESKKKLSWYAKGMIIYSSVLLVAALVVLLVLYNFLNAFESSRPLNCVEAYLSSMEENGLSENFLSALDIIDENIQSREESIAYVEEILPEISFGKSSKLSTQDKPAYLLSYNKKPLGTVYLKALDKHPFGFTFWEVQGDEYDFSNICQSHSLLVPSDCKVFVNGQELSDKYITEGSIKYDSFTGFYDYLENLPLMVKYESGCYLGNPSLQILDSSGKEISPDGLSEVDFLANCTEDEEEHIEEYSREFVNRYVTYTANVYDFYYSNYQRCRELAVPGSQFTYRLEQAIGSFGYTQVDSCDVVKFNLNFCTKQNDHYFADISYTIETVTRKGPYQEDLNIRISMVPNGDSFLTDVMFYY